MEADSLRIKNRMSKVFFGGRQGALHMRRFAFSPNHGQIEESELSKQKANTRCSSDRDVRSSLFHPSTLWWDCVTSRNTLHSDGRAAHHRTPRRPAPRTNHTFPTSMVFLIFYDFFLLGVLVCFAHKYVFPSQDLFFFHFSFSNFFLSAICLSHELQ